MKTAGIICEYNPFHNGHLYQIEETRKNGASHIVVVMSPNFVQRGDVAIVDKFKRAKLAVENGADLVIELPTPYAVSSAEYFARGGVYILGKLGVVDTISFGSECGDIKLLRQAATTASAISNSEDMKELLKDGISYPSAMQKLISKSSSNEIADVLLSPNNLLGIEYLKAIEHFGFNIEPMTILRKNAPHDSEGVSENIASASYIRKCIKTKNDFSNTIPQNVAEILVDAEKNGEIAFIERLEKIILYKLRTMSIDELRQIPDVGQGLENRIFNSVKNSTTYKELIFNIKSKRYPLSRIRRIIINSMLNITKNDLHCLPPYGRILAVNQRGCEILAKSRKNIEIPFSTSLAKLSKTSAVAKRFSEIEIMATDVYNLSLKNIKSGSFDLTTKIQKL